MNLGKYNNLPVDEYGAQTASTTAIARSKLNIGLIIFESHIFTVQSALAEINVLEIYALSFLSFG